MTADETHLDATDPRGPLRRGVYVLLIVLSVATMAGRITTVHSKSWRTPAPLLSANDRSRWCTIRALVDHGTYAIDEVSQTPGWDSIDKVRHEGRDGQMHYYSSKPPLYPTLLAGQYWLIRKLTPMSLEDRDEAFYIVRLMLLLTHVVPMIVYFVLLARLIERWGGSDWGRMFVMACATFGTLVTPLASTLNNHLPAAVCALIALYAAARIWFDGQRSPVYFAVAGLFAALTAANELPALSLFSLLGLALLWRAPKQTLLAGVPAAALVVVGFFGTNYLAHDTLAPPYTQRHVEGGWYDYPDSYWNKPKQGLDAGEANPAVYVAHATVGHHGIFSLTPIWLLSVAGVVLMFRNRHTGLRDLATLIVVLTVVCFAFYMTRSLEDRNYGGQSCGLRWMFWFTPLWLLAMIPAADAVATRRLWRNVALALLLISAFSAAYAAVNPWSHPWLYDYWTFLGWIRP